MGETLDGDVMVWGVVGSKFYHFYFVGLAPRAIHSIKREVK